jgi:hypothetical protein
MVDITVFLDIDEHTLRMGYGSLTALEALRNAGIHPMHSAGFRSAVLIVDTEGWVFTPTALYLEAEPHSDATPNAVRLTETQVNEMLIRLCPKAREEAIYNATTPIEARRIADTALEIGEEPLDEYSFEMVKQAIELAPPVKFDVARQVRVFEPYLQYVELTLSGAAIQRHRVSIPKTIQLLGSSKDIEGRLRTTFDLIEKSSQFSSKTLDAELNDIRKNFTPSLGKDHGRVVLKNAKPHLIKRLQEFRQKLKAHQEKVEKELQARLDESRKQVVEYYLPLAKANPPDVLLGQSLSGTPSEKNILDWLEKELDSVFPKAENMIHEMSLEERFKDVTYETLNQTDFLESIKKAFPLVNWDKAYSEFKAAGETT